MENKDTMLLTRVTTMVGPAVFDCQASRSSANAISGLYLWT